MWISNTAVGGMALVAFLLYVLSSPCHFMLVDRWPTSRNYVHIPGMNKKENERGEEEEEEKE